MLALPPSLADERFGRATFSRSICPRSLQRYSNVAVAPMAIVVNTGHVTLEGVVANEGDKGRSERRATYRHRVFSAADNLGIENRNTDGQ
jgi:hypothetical protein